ncbi:MAG: S-adenosyl-l-methionine hydroxide adenosyltransferase family protein [Desulfobulbus sp.]
MEQASPVITLTTDFGLSDPYVGQLKGALLKGCPSATLVDITHAVPTWDVLAAALALHTSYRYFPTGTVHLVVVDPGVGSSRSILAARGEGYCFVCPDNGILSFLLAKKCVLAVHRVEAGGAPGKSISPTFHGRDIMAPVAAALARGEGLETFGPALGLSSLERIGLPRPASVDGGLRGQVLSVDHFGNVRTNLRLDEESLNPSNFSALEIQGHRISTMAAAYSEVPVGGLLVLRDSSGFLEIAANQANAAVLIGCVPGDPLTLEFHGK